MSKFRLAVWLILLVITFSLGYIFARFQTAPPLVRISRAVTRDWPAYVDGRGIIQPRSRARLSFAQSGRLAALYLGPGESVAQGKPIAKLDNHFLELKVQEAEAQLARTRAQWEKLPAKSHPQDAAQAKAEIAYREARVALARNRLDQSLISAPFSGVISRVFAQPGEWLAKGDRVVELVELSRVWARVQLPETGWGRIKKGQPVRLKARAYPDDILFGRVDRILAEGDNTGQTFPLLVKVDNPRLLLRGGMHVTAQIEVAAARKVWQCLKRPSG
jgi:multidrug efflux pump subunit AcrA (membrane-fusion protein)